MDIFNPEEELGKTSEMNNRFWKNSLSLQDSLEVALEVGADDVICRLLKNPSIYQAIT